MRAFVESLEQTRATGSRLAKIAALAAGLRAAAEEGPEALALAARLAVGRVLPPTDGRTLGVGWRLIAGVATSLTGATDAEVRDAVREHGDLGDAIHALYARVHERDPRPGITFAELGRLVEELAGTAARADKSARLLALLTRATPLEAKYVVKALLGELRTGAVEGVLLAAIAEAFSVPMAEARRAIGVLADSAEVAVLARAGRLSEATVRPGRPLGFMLATPLEAVASPIDWTLTMAEDKLDGVRAQVHVRGGEVAIFARGLERVTQAFPEIARAFQTCRDDVVLDGEIVATADDGRVRPFQALQMRLNRVAPDEALIAQVPTKYVAFDILLRDAKPLLELPWSERRAALELYARELGPRERFVVNPAYPIAGREELDAAFERARARGQEGLVLKRVDSVYEAARRGQAWIKVKKAFATLDVVVTAVEEGHGKRAGMLSDYTFAVRDEEGRLVDVGKAYSGLSDAEIAELGRTFESTTIERRGGKRVVEPTVVIEVGFDGVQRSKRHASGFALRFPRIHRIRTDKKPEEVDTVATVEALLRSQVSSGHREDASGREPPRRRGKKASAQLPLFEDADAGATSPSPRPPRSRSP